MLGDLSCLYLVLTSCEHRTHFNPKCKWGIKWGLMGESDVLMTHYIIESFVNGQGWKKTKKPLGRNIHESQGTKQPQSITNPMPYFTEECQVFSLCLSSFLWPNMLILCITKIWFRSHLTTTHNVKCTYIMKFRFCILLSTLRKVFLECFQKDYGSSSWQISNCFIHYDYWFFFYHFFSPASDLYIFVDNHLSIFCRMFFWFSIVKTCQRDFTGMHTVFTPREIDTWLNRVISWEMKGKYN